MDRLARPLGPDPIRKLEVCLPGNGGNSASPPRHRLATQGPYGSFVQFSPSFALILHKATPDRPHGHPKRRPARSLTDRPELVEGLGITPASPAGDETRPTLPP